MQSLIAFGLAGSASAAALLARDQCCFQLTASGGVSGTVGQLGDGQNRVGGGYSPASYCINGGAITDGSGRGCILTPPTTQLQCDQGASPTYGFSITSSGQVEHDGSGTFYACPATETEYNIYTEPVEGQKKCVEITLSTNGKCSGSGSGYGNGGASSSASMPVSSHYAYTTVTVKPSTYQSPPQSTAPPASTYSQPAPSSYQAPSSYSHAMESSSTPVAPSSYSYAMESSSAPAAPSSYKQSSGAASMPAASGTTPGQYASACQTSLTGAYQTPHLIVPVSSSHPDEAYGTQYNGTINSETSTIFNFDIPQSYEGKTCSIIFLFPELSQLQTSSYDFSGSGEVCFEELSSAADQQTTYNNAPSGSKELNKIAIQPGNSYVVASESCHAGQTESIELKSVNGLSLSFFEDWNPASLGLYITAC